jgi:hypothetical protein
VAAVLKRFFLYGMPLYLIVIEVASRHFLAGEAVNYALSGPTVAVAGLSLMLPISIPKRVETPQNLPPNYTAVDKSDQRLIEIAMIAFFVLIAAWVLSIYLAYDNQMSILAIIIGSLIYAIGIIFTELKNS